MNKKGGENLNRYVGIDRTELRNIRVDSIDIDTLRATDSRISFTNNELGYLVHTTTGEAKRVDRLVIKDGYMFNSFRLDYKKMKGDRNYYTILDVTIATKEGESDNLRPLNISEYRNKINNIKHYIQDRYGVILDISEARFNTIEVNVTNEMMHTFHDYRMIFEAVRQKRNHKKYPVFGLKEKKLQYETYIFSNKSLTNELKLYNKTEQLAYCFKIYKKENFMRFEYRLNSYELIENRLGTSRVSELTDQNIRDFLSESIQEDIFKPVETFINDSNKELDKMYKNIKKKYKRGHIRQFAQYCSQKEVQILDMEQVIAIAKKDMSKSNHFKLNYKIVDEVMPDVLKNNLEKLAELQDKFILEKV